MSIVTPKIGSVEFSTKFILKDAWFLFKELISKTKVVSGVLIVNLLLGFAAQYNIFLLLNFSPTCILIILL